MPTDNAFLTAANMLVRKGRPLTSKSFNYSTWTNPGEESLYRGVWFQTRGCRFDYAGECTMCDYWISARVSADNMVEYVQQALDTVDIVPEVLIVSPSGSMFDSWEVPDSARQGIFQVVAKYGPKFFQCETRADFVTPSLMKEYRELFSDKPLGIEIGLESANPWVLSNCVNKSASLDATELANATAHTYDISTTANVLIGHAFLSPLEAIEDAMRTIDWAFTHGTDRCVVFPIHVKPWTLLHWLWERKLYTCPSLWSLIEVLRRVGPERSPHVHISWYHPQYSETHLANDKYSSQAPTTCPLCERRVLALLDVYRRERSYSTVEALAQIDCACKREWFSSLAEVPALPLNERVLQYYSVIDEELLVPGGRSKGLPQTLGVFS